MKKSKMLKAMDTLIIVAIVIQFAIFLVSYETELLITLTAIIQFTFLLVYLIYSIRLRAYFETVVNQERVFFDKQFREIKYSIKELTYRISEYFDRQRDIEDLRQPFRHTKVYYQKQLTNEDGSKTSIDLLLVTEKGLVVIDFFEARFILKGDYQNDLVDIQYSESNVIRMVNPLSPQQPLVQALKKLLNIKDNALIKRMMIVENESLIMGMDSLNDHQQIAKEIDIPKHIRQLADQSQVVLSKEQIETYESILDEKITG